VREAEAKEMACLAVTPAGAAWHAVLPLAPSGLASASRLCSEGAARHKEQRNGATTRQHVKGRVGSWQWAQRWAALWHGARVTGQRSDGKLASDDAQTQAGEGGFGGEIPDRWGPHGSDRGVGNGCMPR
jgi:hypothetical protein